MDSDDDVYRNGASGGYSSMSEKVVELDSNGVSGPREKSSSWFVISSSVTMTCRGEGVSETRDSSLLGLPLWRDDV